MRITSVVSGELRDRTGCITVMGEQSGIDVVSTRIREGDVLSIEGIRLKAIYTPGHTDDSYSFQMSDRVFTGDTLMIRGTGRTDFQNGDPRAQYDSLFNKLLKLPPDTLVYPAHDYKGCTVSTIGEERDYNPRLQVAGEAEYVELMNNLNLAHPKMMDVAVPANLHMGLDQDALKADGLGVAPDSWDAYRADGTTLVIDLRSPMEVDRDGPVEHAVHAAYRTLKDELEPDGALFKLIGQAEKTLFVCSFGELAALAARKARAAGLERVFCLLGGLQSGSV